jgi:hypothetical protein
MTFKDFPHNLQRIGTKTLKHRAELAMYRHFSPEDGDSMFLRNVGNYRRVYTAPKPGERHHYPHRHENLKSLIHEIFKNNLILKRRAVNCFMYLSVDRRLCIFLLFLSHEYVTCESYFVMSYIIIHNNSLNCGNFV